LPGQIMARLETEPEPSIWEKFLPTFGFKPAYAYAFGFAVCGSLILAIGYTWNAPDQRAAQPFKDDSLKLASPSTTLPSTAQGLVLKPLEPSQLASTNPAAPPEKPRSLFDGLQLRQQQEVQPASFQGN